MLASMILRSFQVHFEQNPYYTSDSILMYTPRHPLLDTSNCTQWHNPSQLYCILCRIFLQCFQVHCPTRCQVHFRWHSVLLLACGTVVSGVYSQGRSMNSTEHLVKQTTEPLSSTTPSTPSYAHPVALDGILLAYLAPMIQPVLQWMSLD